MTGDPPWNPWNSSNVPGGTGANDAPPANGEPADDGATGHDRPEGASRGPFERLGRKLDGLPPLKAAEDAVRRARAEFQRAADQYRSAKENAADKLDEVRSRPLGDLLNDALAYARRHPASSLAAAALVGFVCGRLGRR